MVEPETLEEVGTPYNDLCGEAPSERGAFFTLQVYERVGISRNKVHVRVGKSIIQFRFIKGPFINCISLRYTKGAPFVNRRYTKEISFLPKMVHTRVRGRTSPSILERD